MQSNFENLPNEVLMIIFQYSGDIYTILRTYLGLNQRLNNILIDKHLHLFTDFLCINMRDDYYNSDVFQYVSQQLLSTNTIIDEQKLSQLLQELLSFHIKQKYIEIGYELQLSLKKFKSIREQLTNDEIIKIDQELNIQFYNLQYTPIIKKHIKSIKSLILLKGARQICDDYELGRFNLTRLINEQFLAHINNNNKSNNFLLELFQTLLISYIPLLKNRGYVGNGGSNLTSFLIHNLYRLYYYFNSNCVMPVNMENYRATVDLFLFVLQCQKQLDDYKFQIQETMFEILYYIPKIHNDIFIQTAQLEILKIVIDEYLMEENEPWDDHLMGGFKNIFGRLVQNNRLDVIKYIYPNIRFQQFFKQSDYIRAYLKSILRNRLERKHFCMIIEEKSLDLLFSKNDLLFYLLDKKERKLLEKIFKLSPYLIHELDTEGNDPLLYICLKVNGCRHRIIDFLIKIGSNLQRKNFQGQNFMDILHLQKNKKLLQKLIDHEIISIDI